MCLKVKSSLSKVNKVVASCELTFLILDEIGYLVVHQYLFHTHVPEKPSSCVTSIHDLCEDG